MTLMIDRRLLLKAGTLGLGALAIPGAAQIDVNQIRLPFSTPEAVATFTDAGACNDVCQMACTRLPDGSQRCAATACKDPTGRTWRFPITTHLRNRIEAGNADAMTNVRAETETLTKWRRGATATYKSVDFGTPDRSITTFSAGWAAPRAGGRIEIWLDGTRRLGALALKKAPGVNLPQSTAVSASGISGLHDIVLKVFEVPPAGRLSTIELR
jgi:hypothetical protein